MLRQLVVWVGLAVGVLVWGIGWAQERYPSKAINFIIPFDPGGSADIEARVFANVLERVLGQPVVPVNRPGGGGSVAYAFLRTAPKDGYTVGWASSSILTNYRLGTMPFSYKEFDPVALVSVQAMAWVVRADSPWRTFRELQAYAKANPGKVRVATAGPGSGTDMVALAIAKAAGIEVVRVPLGSGARVPALLRGDVEVASVPVPEAIQQIRGGQLRALVVTSEERDPALPQTPTLKELGFPVTMELFRGIVVPKGVAAERIQILAEAIRKAVQSQEWREFGEKNFFVPRFLGPEAFAKYLEEQDAAIRAEVEGGR